MTHHLAQHMTKREDRNTNEISYLIFCNDFVMNEPHFSVCTWYLNFFSSHIFDLEKVGALSEYRNGFISSSSPDCVTLMPVVLWCIQNIPDSELVVIDFKWREQFGHERFLTIQIVFQYSMDWRPDAPYSDGEVIIWKAGITSMPWYSSIVVKHVLKSQILDQLTNFSFLDFGSFIDSLLQFIMQ